MRRPFGLLSAALGATLLLALSAGQAFADHVHCGDLITQDVRLEADLTNCPGDGLVVDAPNITIDLNGHTISGTGTRSGIRNASIPTDPYEDPASNYVGVAVENGTLRGFPEAIYSVADGQTFRRLTVDGQIDACCFGRRGYSEPDGDQLLESHVTGRVSLGHAAVVERNRIEGGLGVGSGRVAGNVVTGGLGQFSGRARVAGPILVEDNVISGSEYDGISLASTGARVEHNAIYGNAGNGVSVYLENVSGTYSISGNRIYSNKGDGLQIGAGVCEEVSGNRIFRNAGSGIHADYVGQDTTPYQGASGACALPHRFLHNSVYLNGADGIYAANNRSPIVLVGNSADRNGTDGVHVGRAAGEEINPSWSPDGGRIAFQSSRGASWDIFVTNPDGTAMRRLTSDPAADTNPQWSPDGSAIAFESDRGGSLGLYAMNADGSGVRKLAALDADSGFAWSPDGKRIAFGGDYLYAVNADGTGLTKLSDARFAAAPTWSPDSSRIAFQTNMSPTTEATIYVVNADGTGLRPLRTARAGESTPADLAWSPDGSRIAFTMGDAYGTSAIWTISPDGSGLLRFGPCTDPLTHPRWSPDGTMLVFQSAYGRFRTGEVFVENANNSVDWVDLTAGRLPAWSPNGGRIVYSTGSALAMISPDGSGRTSIGIDFNGSATLGSNSADRNHALGIDAAPGVFDRGGNRAKHNGDSRQCLNVNCRTPGKPQ